MTDHSLTPMLAIVVNPIAGIGGTAGLKGSDGAEVQKLAAARGGMSHSHDRAVLALRELAPGTHVLTAGGALGEAAVREAGLVPEVVSHPREPSSAVDTSAAVSAFVEAGASLILFAGGDGTARDVVNGLGESQSLILGIPTGVKMYSSCFAVSPEAAGRIASGVTDGSITSTTECEVLDISEDDIREGRVNAQLFGIARIPQSVGRTQARKAAVADSAQSEVTSVARGVISMMSTDHVYFLGPGSTMRSVGKELGIDKTPLGFDAIKNGQLIARDLSAQQMCELAKTEQAHAIVSVIGGQGFMLGRGNQQLSPEVLRLLTEPRVTVAANKSKLINLRGPLLIDTGDREVDHEFAQPTRVIVANNEVAIVNAVSAADDSKIGNSS